MNHFKLAMKTTVEIFFYPSVKTVSLTLKGKRVSCICKPLPLVKQYKMIKKVQPKT